MVAVTPRGHKAVGNAKHRLSPLALFLFVMGIAIAYSWILISFAVNNTKTTLQEKELRTRQSQPKDQSLPTSKQNRQPEPQDRESNPEIASQQFSTGKVKAQVANPQKKTTPPDAEATSQVLPSAPGKTSRGKNNFRNIVIPNLSFREKGRKAGWMAKPHGEGVKPQQLFQTVQNDNREKREQETTHPRISPHYILKAYVEPIDFQEWEQKPLPIRSTATADQLEVIEFPQLDSCKSLPEMIPADEYPDHDPFLPWIHDVFPTWDGQFIQFVAQNRRRCHTGKTAEEKEILHLTQPSIALFQHVPVKRIKSSNKTQATYRLSSHEEADPDGVATRFICRFKPSMEETLSTFNFDYDYGAHRKRTKNTFQYKDGGILSVHLSQLAFRCPVPEGLVETVKSGRSVKDNLPTLFVDIIPIRTPPRYGLSSEFLQPRYSDRLPENIADRFDPEAEWGNGHILPRIEDSGRWENIPICKPTLEEYYSGKVDPKTETKEVVTPVRNAELSIYRNSATPPRKHRLVACLWASAGYSTRGNRFAINDGQRRLLEWIHFNKLLGFEHFYLYDNSYAHSQDVNLQPIADLFPNEITYIKWPFQVCNNNPNNVDSPGERSSQYAAESSCRLRFGPHVEWIGQFDIDEYLIPMGNYTSMLSILDKLDQEGTKILSFGSWRAWPRRDLIEDPVPIKDRSLCNNQHTCFDLQIPSNTTVLQTYNCDRQSGPKKEVMPAEKQLYRPDYVLQHFVHYASITVLSDMNRTEFEKAGYKWLQTKMKPDPLSRFGDELTEATMLHTKSVARQDTAGWLDICKGDSKAGGKCRIGAPFPQNYNEERHGTKDSKGWLYNCYVNQRTEHYWVPLLAKTLKEAGHVFFGS